MSTDTETQSAAGAMRAEAAGREREQREERVELSGVARDLFLARYEDTFEVEVHGETVEFYRPVNASNVEIQDVDDEVRERIERGSKLLDEFQERQLAVIQQARGDVDLNDLLEESMGGVEQMSKVLAAHAVDDSLTEPLVWRSIYRNDDKLSEVFEDFIAEGDGESSQKKLDALENILSDNSSTN